MLGISLSLPAVLSSCGADEEADFQGKVLIIGAGAAGMTAGYLLAQKGVDFQILEASPVYGGRFRINNGFASFPIPLGAEWLHVPPVEFKNIVNDDSVDVAVETVAYTAADTYAAYSGGKLETEPLTGVDGSEDRKFVDYSWFDFYEEYIVPSIRSNIVFETPITEIDYSDDQVVLTDEWGDIHTADKVIVTVPLKLLQQGEVEFVPELPARKQEAIDEADVWSGLKVFLEFTEKFFPTYLEFLDGSPSAGQLAFYDASYGQDSETHIMGVFSVGAPAEAYQAMSDEELLANILETCDELFDGAASRTFIKHLVQNWNAEPYARAAYLSDYAPAWVSRALAESVGDKLYFAGTAYTQENDWGGVHNAARAAKDAVNEIV